MSKKRPPDTDEEIVVAIADVLEAIPEPIGDQEVDAVLREAGLDPDEVGCQLESFMDGVIRQERKAIRERAEARTRRMIDTMSAQDLPETELEIIAAIRSMVAQQELQFSTEYRNLETQTKEDLLELLQELTALSEEGSED